MRFDWYGATVPARPEAILEALRVGLGERVAGEEQRSPAGNYGTGNLLLDGSGQRLCAVLYGGQNGWAGPHVQASGEHSPEVVAIVREHWPQHRVSRADVAVDFDGDGCFEKLLSVAEGVARENRLKWSTYGDFRDDRDPLAGRTFYVGSRQSAALVRGYEKGKQMLPSVRVGEEAPSLDWCRLEVEVKPPTREAKAAAAGWPVDRFWGCSPWTCKLLHRVAGVDVQRVTMTAHKETDARRAIRHMAMQYRQAMEAFIAEEGGEEEALLRFIRQVWKIADITSHAA